MIDVFRGFPVGLSLTLRGVGQSFSSKSVRWAYARLVLAVLCLSILLESAGVWAIFEWVDFGADPVDTTAAGRAPGEQLDGALAWVSTLAVDAGAWLVRVLAILALTLVVPVVAITIVNLIFPLFNDRLFMAAMAEAAPERAAELAQSPGPTFLRSMALTLRRLGRFIGVSCIILVIGLMPLVGPPVALALQSWYSCRMLIWELLDPYFERRQLEWADQREHLIRNRGPGFGFGLPFTWMMAIPIIGPMGFGVAQASVVHLVLYAERKPAQPASVAPSPAV